MLYPEGIPQTDVVAGMEETLGLDAAEEVVEADRLLENTPFDPGVGLVHGFPEGREVTGRRRHCPGSIFWPRDRPWPGDRVRPGDRFHSGPRLWPWSSFGPRDRPRPRDRHRDSFCHGDRSRCRGRLCRRSLTGNRKSGPCKQRKNHRQDNNPRTLQRSKSNGMHFPARKIIDTYLSRNHVAFHTFSSVCESITFIKSKCKSSFCKVEISINSLVESRGAAHQDLWYSNIREAMKGGDDHERHETFDDEAAADDADDQTRQAPDGGSSYRQLQCPCHYPARHGSG